jgi:hypothetical protein
MLLLLLILLQFVLFTFPLSFKFLLLFLKFVFFTFPLSFTLLLFLLQFVFFIFVINQSLIRTVNILSGLETLLSDLFQHLIMCIQDVSFDLDFISTLTKYVP